MLLEYRILYSATCFFVSSGKTLHSRHLYTYQTLKSTPRLGFCIAYRKDSVDCIFLRASVSCRMLSLRGSFFLHMRHKFPSIMKTNDDDDSYSMNLIALIDWLLIWKECICTSDSHTYSLIFLLSWWRKFILFNRQSKNFNYCSCYSLF